MPISSLNPPTDVKTINRWSLYIGSTKHATFTEVSPFTRETDVITRKDGGSRRTYKVLDGYFDYGTITLTRTETPDGSDNDGKISKYLDDAIDNNTPINGTIVKSHHGEQIERIEFIGIIHREETSNLDKAGSGAFKSTYTLACIIWSRRYI